MSGTQEPGSYQTSLALAELHLKHLKGLLVHPPAESGCAAMPRCVWASVLLCRAAAAGVQTVFIVGGIHAADVHLQGAAADDNMSCSWDEAALAQLCRQHGVQPTFCMPYLQP